MFQLRARALSGVLGAAAARLSEDEEGAALLAGDLLEEEARTQAGWAARTVCGVQLAALPEGSRTEVVASYLREAVPSLEGPGVELGWMYLRCGHILATPLPVPPVTAQLVQAGEASAGAPAVVEAAVLAVTWSTREVALRLDRDPVEAARALLLHVAALE